MNRLFILPIIVLTLSLSACGGRAPVPENPAPPPPTDILRTQPPITEEGDSNLSTVQLKKME